MYVNGFRVLSLKFGGKSPKLAGSGLDVWKNYAFVTKIYESSEGFCCGHRNPANPCHPGFVSFSTFQWRTRFQHQNQILAPGKAKNIIRAGQIFVTSFCSHKICDRVWWIFLNYRFIFSTSWYVTISCNTSSLFFLLSDPPVTITCWFKLPALRLLSTLRVDRDFTFNIRLCRPWWTTFLDTQVYLAPTRKFRNTYCKFCPTPLPPCQQWSVFGWP